MKETVLRAVLHIDRHGKKRYQVTRACNGRRIYGATEQEAIAAWHKRKARHGR